MEIEDLLDAWRVNNAVTTELLNVCAEEVLDFKPGKGKTIRSNFVHLIGVRRLWIEERMKGESGSIPKLDYKSASHDELRNGLETSSEIMARLFEKLSRNQRKSRFSLLKFFAYCIAHEAHHRSQIEIALRINGVEPDDKFLYGLWDWSKK